MPYPLCMSNHSRVVIVPHVCIVVQPGTWWFIRTNAIFWIFNWRIVGPTSAYCLNIVTLLSMYSLFSFMSQNVLNGERPCKFAAMGLVIWPVGLTLWQTKWPFACACRSLILGWTCLFLYCFLVSVHLDYFFPPPAKDTICEGVFTVWVEGPVIVFTPWSVWIPQYLKLQRESLCRNVKNVSPQFYRSVHCKSGILQPEDVECLKAMPKCDANLIVSRLESITIKVVDCKSLVLKLKT